MISKEEDMEFGTLEGGNSSKKLPENFNLA